MPCKLYHYEDASELIQTAQIQITINQKKIRNYCINSKRLIGYTVYDYLGEQFLHSAASYHALFVAVSEVTQYPTLHTSI